EMLHFGGERDPAAARAKLERAIASGAALHKFADIAAAQGGDRAAVLDGRLPSVETRAEVTAEHAGHVSRINTEAIGMAALALGAGGLRREDNIDPAVGIELLRKCGDRGERGEPLALLHHRDGRGVDEARARIRAAYVIGDGAAAGQGPIVLDVLRGEAV